MFKKIIEFLIDWELFKKPSSTKLRNEIISDILSVDPKKWFHPNLPNGETNPYWGTFEIKEGKEVFSPGKLDLFTFNHPNLNYEIKVYPLICCKAGEFENITKKDCSIIRDVLYTSKDKSVNYINLNLCNNFWYIIYKKTEFYHSLLILIVVFISIYFLL